MTEDLKNKLVNYIKNWCTQACLRAYDEFDDTDPEYASKVYNRIQGIYAEAEAELRAIGSKIKRPY